MRKEKNATGSTTEYGTNNVTKKAVKETKRQKVKKSGSIQTKLLLIMIPLMALAVFVIMAVSYVSTKNNMTSSAYQTLEKESELNVEKIESWSGSILSALNAFQNTLENANFLSQREELAFLSTSMDIDPSMPNGVVEGNGEGDYLDGSGWQPGKDFVVTERNWYKEGLTHERFAFGAPYLDTETGSYVISASAIIHGRRYKDTIAAADIFLTDLAKTLADTKVLNCETGYVFLVDTSSNDIMAHRDADMISQKLTPADANPFLASIASDIAVNNYEIQEKRDGLTTYLTCVEPVENTQWVLVSCVSEDEVLEGLHHMQIVYITMALVIFAVVALIMGFVINRTIAPVKTLTKGISRIADGDFTVKIAPKGNDEITVMSKALRDYIVRMNGVIKEIMMISMQLKEKSEVSNSTAATLNQTAETQSQSMQDMKATINQLATAVTEVAENATSLAQVVDVTSSKGAEANSKMKMTVDVADKGYQDMQNVQGNMQEIVNSIQELSGVVENVGKSTTEINSILSLIEDIASQTNLLSLNASIEAARAGEAGRGFAVVAGEIGHLADVSSNSTRQIGEIVTKINQQVSNMVEKTKSSVVSIEGNSVAVNSACTTFQTIFEEISKTSDLLTSMLEQIQQVDDVATNMAAISEEQSASAEEILATIEVLASNSEQLTDESRQVEECASVVAESSVTLEENMKKFKTTEA